MANTSVIKQPSNEEVGLIADGTRQIGNDEFYYEKCIFKCSNMFLYDIKWWHFKPFKKSIMCLINLIRGNKSKKILMKFAE